MATRFGALARRAGGGLSRGAKATGRHLGRAGSAIKRGGAAAFRKVRESGAEIAIGTSIGAGTVTAIVAVDELTGIPPGISAAGAAVATGIAAASSGPKWRGRIKPAMNQAAGIALYFGERAIIKFVKNRKAAGTKGDF